MPNIGAFITGCAGLAFNPEERSFVQKCLPWGLILFARNCDSPEQIKSLTDEFRALTKRKDAPVFVDQEGGRVQRLGPAKSHWRKYPSAAAFGRLYKLDPLRCLRAGRNVARLMAEDLSAVGISVNCMPVLDVPNEATHAVIGDRAYHAVPEIAMVIARSHMNGLMDGGVLPVMKHIPGHGRATVDSHHELPSVKADRAALENVDFRTFAGFADCPMAMTAHVVYRVVDPHNPATLSKGVIREVVRKQLGFNGLLITDDLSMKALTGTLGDRAHRAIAAGCDIALHCNGDLGEMEEVAAAAGPLKSKSLARAKAALRARRKPVPFDQKLALKDLEAVMEHHT